MANLILNRGIVDNEEFLGEAIDFEPIDNSDVEIEEGNKLYIHPIDTENPKLKNITHIFNASIKDLERHIGNENKVFSHHENTENSLTLHDIHDAFGENNPYIVKMSYDFSDDDKDYIQEQNLEDAALDTYIVKEVLPRYPQNGFLALSAVGDFALIWRFTNAIKQLKEGENYSPRLAEWIFDSKYARLPETNTNSQELIWSNESIASNRFQKEAVEKMLQAPDLFLLQGPPGTGKTTVIAEAIYQLVKQGKRGLLSSQSNDAVDNALERLANTPEIRALRIGGKKKKTKNADEDLALNKFSEETALKYYYKSISAQISERMLDKWSSLADNETELKTDKRDLKNFNQQPRRKRRGIKPSARIKIFQIYRLRGVKKYLTGLNCKMHFLKWRK